MANLKNRNFLKLLDFKPEEILYLLELSGSLKDAKKSNTEVTKLTNKNIALFLKKHLPEQDVHLR